MNVRSALIAGTIASFAMNAAQAGIDAVFERGRSKHDRDEEVEAIASLVNDMAKRLSRKPAFPAIDRRVLHYLFGGGLALFYCRLRERAPVVTVADGAVFGMALWIVSDLLLIRAIGLVRKSRRYSPAERANALFSHLTYGVALESIARSMPAN
jgi:putative membrane protein